MLLIDVKQLDSEYSFEKTRPLQIQILDSKIPDRTKDDNYNDKDLV